MDGIITIVVIAAAVIFKLVGKKLSSAAGDEVFPTILPEQEHAHFPLEEEKPKEMPRPVVVAEKVFEEAPRALPPKPAMKKPAPVVIPEKKVTAPILEEEQPEEKEKIDPKKLVVYSEIMKPKYLE